MTTELFWILAGTTLTLFVCFGFGRWLLSALGLYQATGERRTMALLAGAVILSGLVFALSITKLLYPPAFPAVAALAGVAWWSVRRKIQPATPPENKPNWWALALAPVLLAYAGLYALHGAAPDYSFDSIYYHLGFVNHYLRDHGFSMFRDNIYEALSQGAELLYVYAAGIGGLSSATLLHVAFTVVWGAGAYYLLLRRASAVVALSAAVLIVASPVVGRTAVTGYIDCIAAAYCLGTVWAIELWLQERNDRWLVIAGLLGGFCYAVKYTAFVALVYALIVVLFTRRKELQFSFESRGWRSLTWLSAFAAIPILPWVLRNAVWYGNPFAPFFNKWFPNPYFFVVEEIMYRRNLRTYGWLESYWQLPYEWFFDGRHLQGIIGFGFLLAPIALLGVRSAFGRRMLLALALFLAVYPSNVGVRFLMPALSFAAILIAYNLRALAPVLVLAVLAHSYAAWPRILRTYVPYGAVVLPPSPRWAEVTRKTPEREFLSNWAPPFQLSELIREANPSGGQIFGFMPHAEAHSDYHLCLDFASARCKNTGQLIYTAVFAGYHPTVVESRKFEATSTHGIQLQLATTNPAMVWAIHEIRFYYKGTEVSRQPSWRLTASEMPGLTRYAFDGSPATSWSTWAFATDASTLGVDFREPTSIDEVRLWIAPVFRFAKVHLSAKDSDGSWKALEYSLSAEEIEQPNMPREAALAVRREGIHYILAPKDHQMTPRIVQNMYEMGLDVVANSREGILFHIRDDKRRAIAE